MVAYHCGTAVRHVNSMKQHQLVGTSTRCDNYYLEVLELALSGDELSGGSTPTSRSDPL